MGFEISILAVIAVILLTTYLVMHILSSNDDSADNANANDTPAANAVNPPSTDPTAEYFDCGKKHVTEQEHFANPVDKDDYQNMEHFHGAQTKYELSNPNAMTDDQKKAYQTRLIEGRGDTFGPDEVTALKIDNESELNGVDVVEIGHIHVDAAGNEWVDGESEGDKLHRREVKDNRIGRGNDIKLLPSGELDMANIQRRLGNNVDDAARGVLTKKERAATMLEGARRDNVIRSGKGVGTMPNDSESCKVATAGQDEGNTVCLFELSTRDTCINRNSYDIRGTCHIENQGPLPAPQPPKCPCDSTTADKWKANMCKTLGGGVDCDTNSQDNCDNLWDDQYQQMVNTAGKSNSDKCWYKTSGSDRTQCSYVPVSNDLMPNAK